MRPIVENYYCANRNKLVNCKLLGRVYCLFVLQENNTFICEYKEYQT